MFPVEKSYYLYKHLCFSYNCHILEVGKLSRGKTKQERICFKSQESVGLAQMNPAHFLVILSSIAHCVDVLSCKLSLSTTV